ncbi:MAG: hypothetical protein GXY54_11940 [Deltaproteobacteria bacterium]|nr:hypothetical protein [Deltaproteobacteria bacterium]
MDEVVWVVAGSSSGFPCGKGGAKKYPWFQKSPHYQTPGVVDFRLPFLIRRQTENRPLSFTKNGDGCSKKPTFAAVERATLRIG